MAEREADRRRRFAPKAATTLLSLLHAVVGRKLIFELRDDTIVTGRLTGVDEHMKWALLGEGAARCGGRLHAAGGRAQAAGGRGRWRRAPDRSAPPPLPRSVFVENATWQPVQGAARLHPTLFVKVRRRAVGLLLGGGARACACDRSKPAAANSAPIAYAPPPGPPAAHGALSQRAGPGGNR